jgi:hypothetical protein
MSVYHHIDDGMLVRDRRMQLFFPNLFDEANSLSPTRYRPYKSLVLQFLSCSCACFLVAISGLLLRSLVLVSAGRSPNFEAADPDTESREVSKEILPIIVLLLTFLSCPLLLTIFFLVRSNPSVKNAAYFFFVKAKCIRDFFATRLFHFHSDSVERNKSRSDSDFEKSAAGSSQDVAIELSPNYTQSIVPTQPVFLIFNGYGESDHQLKPQDQGNLSRGAESVQSSTVDRLHIQPLSALHSDDIELVNRDDDIEVVDRDGAVLPSMQSPISFQRRLQTPQARHLTDMIASDSLSSLAPARVSAFLSALDGIEMIHQESGVAAKTSIRPISSQGGRLKTPQARQHLPTLRK